MFYAGYGDMWRRVQEMALRMPDVDAIAGVPVSGIAPAGMLSAATGVKCVPIEAVPENIKRLLVLEDASGFAKCITQRIGQAPGREVLYGAVYACDKAAETMDLIGCIAEKPRIFTWNLTKSDKARRIAYDMDGVICRNPTSGEIDYGPRYERFIATAERLRICPSNLGWIVTGRMERYRSATERWLDENGIRYRELVMASDDQQHTCEAHARHKADWYTAHAECLLFVESHPRQAKMIADMTGRPVVCAETEECWNTAQAQAVSAKRNPRIIYTISTGAYSEHAPHDYRPPSGWDYRVLTDADCPDLPTPKQRAAWAKINGSRIFHNYKASLCIDDDMTVIQDPSPLFDGKAFVALRRDSLPTWRDDFREVVNVRKAVPNDLAEKEIARLSHVGITDGPAYLSGVLYRQHTPETRALCDAWWAWYMQSETHRDQPSFAAACIEAGRTLDTVTEQEMREYIKHDTRKADRDGVRVRVQTEHQKRRPRRRGDK